MVDGLHIHKGNRIMKPLEFVLRGTGKGWQGDRETEGLT
jgi:hypothetical protein